mgnify:FL=1
MLQVCLFSYSNVSASEVDTTPVLVAPPPPTPAPASSETSPNLINNNNWNGATYGADPGGCCASISGSGALYDTTTDTIMFSYGQDILTQTIAINQALKQSGVEVDGYNYGWTWRTISNNGRGGDTLQFEVTVKDASGNEVERYVYDYSSANHMMNFWYTESGTETFAQSYLDPQNISLSIIGKDGGFWAGYYGPEVRDVSLTLNYSANPCAADPLYDPSCSGYAEAYAQQQYDLSCQADPMYDSGCPGYQQAYYNQQCSYDPLYDSGCPNYAQAYYDQQCSIDPLYDSGCTGYAEAYFDQQCSIDPFYDTTCDGYAQAYYDQQCGLDALYDRGCSGYGEAYAQKYILNEDTTSTETQVSETQTESSPISSAEEIAQVSVTGDATVDSILRETANVSTPTVVMEVASVESSTTEEPTTEEQTTEETVNEETVSESSGDVEESMDSTGNEESSESTDSASEDSSESDSEGDSESSKQDSKSDKKKKLVAARAKSLAEKMSDAASLEAQQAVQAQVLALIAYVPNFATYGGSINGGYYADAQGYPDAQVPESRRGLRNGLAQQLLHEKMVDMQYENLTDK